MSKSRMSKSSADHSLFVAIIVEAPRIVSDAIVLGISMRNSKEPRQEGGTYRRCSAGGTFGEGVDQPVVSSRIIPVGEDVPSAPAPASSVRRVTVMGVAVPANVPPSFFHKTIALGVAR